MADVQRIILEQLRRGVQTPEVENTSLFESLATSAVEAYADYEANAKQRSANQVQVGNTVHSQGNQIIDSMKNRRDGTMTNDSISNARNQIQELRDKYVDQYPDAITNIDVNIDRLISTLDNKLDENNAFSHVQNTLKDMELQLLGTEEGGSSMHQEFLNMDERALSENKDKYISKLSNFASTMEDLEETIFNYNLANRIGAQDINNLKDNLNSAMTTFSNQMLYLDNQSGVSIYDKGERRALNLAASGNYTELSDVNKIAEQDLRQDKAALQNSIENDIETWQIYKNALQTWLQEDESGYADKSEEEQNAYAQDIYIDIGKGENQQTLNLSPKELEKRINSLQMSMDKDNRTFTSGEGQRTYYESNRFTDYADIISNNSTLREIFNVEGDERPSIKPSDNRPPIGPSSPITPEAGSLRDKQQNQVQNVEGKTQLRGPQEASNAMAVAENVLKIKPSKPGVNYPNREEFKNATKDLSTRQKAFLSNAYRKKAEIDKLRLQITEISRPGQKTSKKSENKIRSIMKRIDTSQKSLDKLLSKFENSFKSKKTKGAQPRITAPPISQESIDRYLQGGSGESDFWGR